MVGAAGASLALILVHYHTPDLLIRAVKAARGDGLDAHVIVVDNGSHDADTRRLATLPVDYVKAPSNLGYAGGINLGVSRTGASHLMLLNADVEVDAGCLGILCRALDEGAAVAGPRFHWDDAGTLALPPTEPRSRWHALAPACARAGPRGAAWLRRAWRRHARRHWRAVAPLASFSLSGALLAVRRDAWERVGPFDEGFKLYFEETDWLERCRKLGLTARLVPGATALHRYNQSAVQQPLAGTWFAESSRRFEARHHGAWFMALRRRLVASLPPLTAVDLPAGPPALDLAAFRARGPLWVEVSPNPWGTPAAGCRLDDAATEWRLPDDVWRHLAGGRYLVQVVDDAGRELARYAFTRPVSAHYEPAPTVTSADRRDRPAPAGADRLDIAAAVAPSAWLDALRSRLADRSACVEATGFVEATAAIAPGTRAVLVAGVTGLPEEQSLASALRSLHASLAEGGRIFWAGPPAHSRTLRAALPEAGFVIERRSLDGPDGAEILTARADRFVVRAYADGDEAQILPLFWRSFGVRRSRERWAWEYRDNPHGAHRISQAFDAGGQLVAHYAGYPVWFHRSGPGGSERLPALQIGDTMTARHVRSVGRGPSSLFGRTLGHFYARFCEGTVAFNYGFNTDTAQKFSLRFASATRVEPVGFACRETSRPWPRPPLRERLTGLRVERLAGFDTRFDELFARVRDAYALLIERDRRYLTWRYAACPESGYVSYAVCRRERLVGWAVLKPVGDRLVWGDALFDPAWPGAVARVLERAAADHPGARVIEGWLPPRPAWWGAIVGALGFERRPEPEDLSLMAVPFGWDPVEDFRGRLYYAKGDSDLF